MSQQPQALTEIVNNPGTPVADADAPPSLPLVSRTQMKVQHVDTLKVKDRDGNTMIIDAADFDERRHTAVDDEAEDAAPDEPVTIRER